MTETERIIEESKKYLAHNYEPLPVVIAQGRGVWVWDVEGNQYLDMLSGYSALNQGHCHPRIIQALQEQAEILTLTSRAFYDNKLLNLAKKVNNITGKDKFLPMNTGAEAVETAIKATRKWGYTVKGIEKDKAEIITCANNFHGRTTTIIGFSTEDQYREGFGPFTPGFKTIPFDDTTALEQATNSNTAGFLLEPIQGEGGVIVPREGYLKEAFDICKKNNVLFVADEIQTGLGRTGRMFGCYHEGITPDIFILGKALSGGYYPISGIATNDEIMDVFKPGDHGSTFGGNALASIIGTKALEILISEHLPENAKIMGDYFMSKLKELNSPHIKEVRGKGLLIGIELTREAGEARVFSEKLLKEGLLTKDTHHTVLRFAPPLIIEKSQIDFALEKIQKVLGTSTYAY